MLNLDISDPRWSAFVQSCSQALPFHHPAWTQLLAECYRYHPLVLALSDDTGGLIAGAPVLDVSSRLGGRRWASLPFTDYCPLLVKDQHVTVPVTTIIDEARFHKLDALELREGLSPRSGLHASEVAVRHTLDLTAGPAAVYSRFSKMHQRNVRKAEKAGVCVELGRSITDVRAFYRLHLLTRQRLGVPVQPWRFFQLLTDRMLQEHLGFVLIARINGVPAAAGVFLAWNGVLVYKYGASDPRFWEYRPNNLLFREAIRWGCENGYHTFDWGRTDFEDEGLRKFKDGWGAKEEPLVYSVIAEEPARSSSGRVNKAMGTVIRHSPAGVCRVLGELFYRYAA